MFERLKSKKAQAMASEYVITFFIIAAVVGTMTVYLRRAFQARLFDARETMLDTVATRAGNAYTGELLREYEPYTKDTDTHIYRTTADTTRILPTAAGETGIFRKEINSSTKVNQVSKTAPPKEEELSPEGNAAGL